MSGRGSTWSSTSRLGPVRRCAILLRGSLVCAWCASDPTPPALWPGRGLEVDHVLPRAAGGGSDARNLVPACPACNLARGAGTLPRRLGDLGRALDEALAEVARQAALPLDRAAGRDLARLWYPWLDAYREEQRRAWHLRGAAARARRREAALAAVPF